MAHLSRGGVITHYMKLFYLKWNNSLTVLLKVSFLISKSFSYLNLILLVFLLCLRTKEALKTGSNFLKVYYSHNNIVIGHCINDRLQSPRGGA